MFSYISNIAHYKEVLSRVQKVKHNLWIGTADIKDLYVEEGKQKKPFLAVLASLIRRGVEVRLIHAREPGPKFREDFDKYPVLYDRLERVLCPGIMNKIPTLIAQKTGRKEIRYAIPCMEKYLHDTYGILVYQEQLMLLSRQIADFSREESYKLRKALGNKKFKELEDQKIKFITGGLKNGYAKSVLMKIWSEWEKYGTYLFNKAHAVCYTWIAYQTAYLKANYPTEFAE